MLSRKQRGDTIVEVMIVLAVLGMAISIAYATANKSLIAARAAQENSVATSLVAGQVEALRSMSGNPVGDPNNIYTSTLNDFCVKINPPALEVKTNAADCKVSFLGSYDIDIRIHRDANDTFKVRAEWDDLQDSGGQRASASMVYRVHPEDNP